MYSDQLAATFQNMTGYESESMFAETFSSLLGTSLTSSQYLGDVLKKATLKTAFGEEDLEKELEQVAQVIKARGELGWQTQIPCL